MPQVTPGLSEARLREIVTTPVAVLSREILWMASKLLELIEIANRCQPLNIAGEVSRPAAELAMPALVTPVFTGVFDRDRNPLFLGDIVVFEHNGPHIKPEYWNPEYEIIWDAPMFTLKHVGGGKDGGTHLFILRHGGQNGQLKLLRRPKQLHFSTTPVSEPVDVIGKELAATLDEDQRFLLEWLKPGPCPLMSGPCGPALDGLVALGLVSIKGIRVSLTEAGLGVLDALHPDGPVF